MHRRLAGFTLIETMVSLVIIVVGLAGLYATSAQSYTLLRRSKEIVSVREAILCRLDAIRTLSYAELTQATYLSGTLMAPGTAGDATPFGVTTTGNKNFTETLTVYALGSQLFSSDADRQQATPDPVSTTNGQNSTTGGEYASQLDAPAPQPPKTYISNSTAKGDWTQLVAGALPYIQVNRSGTGATAHTSVVHDGGLLSIYPQLRVDVAFSWTDANNITRTQVASTIVSKSGSLQ
jgi:prepilin-type N-terminal cleavage/methylation domain-containing protein